MCDYLDIFEDGLTNVTSLAYIYFFGLYFLIKFRNVEGMITRTFQVV